VLHRRELWNYHHPGRDAWAGKTTAEALGVQVGLSSKNSLQSGQAIPG